MKQILVLGSGESGTGAAILARQQGFEVLVSDLGEIKSEYRRMLDAHAIPYEEGGHTRAEALIASLPEGANW